MASDGKRLEEFVAFVERNVAPPGFIVESNEKVWNGAGVQLAEFDVSVRGKEPSGVSWLIECRDRPSEGAAPGSWIEQLIGRRTRFGFDKVMAVSSTGFSPSAIDAAAACAVELREVRAWDMQDREWSFDFTEVESQSKVQKSTLHFSPEDIAAHGPAIAAAGREKAAGCLISSRTGDSVEPRVLLKYAMRIERLRLPIPDAGVPPRPFDVLLDLPNDEDHLLLVTSDGPVRVRSIRYQGELHYSFKEHRLEPKDPVIYERTTDGSVLARGATWAKLYPDGLEFVHELRQIPATGKDYMSVSIYKRPAK
jgi:hypothetical protein